MPKVEDLKKEVERLQKEKMDFEIDKNLTAAKMENRKRVLVELDAEIKSLEAQKATLEQDIRNSKADLLDELSQRAKAIATREQDLKQEEIDARTRRNLLNEEAARVANDKDRAQAERAKCGELSEKIRTLIAQMAALV